MKTDDKLINIFESSCTLFINSGYNETKMKDIAKLANISVGSLYDLFDSKKALLDFIFLTSLDKSNLNSKHDYPLGEISSTQLVKKTKSTYEIYTKKLDTKLLITDGSYNLESLILDLFDIFKVYGRYFLILEKNPNIDTNLIKLYEKYRQTLYKEISTYLANNTNLRSTTNSDYDSMMIVDLIFWWSTHKKYDSFENYKNEYNMDMMSKTIIDALTKGYQI
ncbi:helix-turn-helix domain-containing protein [Companilactobacillus insicii]|uniref:helix-turn-helix domain-containing protein n=1 Tax=Companilactobacillus insicii TaxID=1732567 RepID=UPI0013DE76AB|nr:TetR/AcrR family transcriptional regulator [Companilactobacillus insicii]